MPEQKTEWNDDQVATLKRLWTDGLSATEIAPHIPGTTRNSIIGKVTRLKLNRSSKAVQKKPSRPKRDPKLVKEENRQRSIILRKQDAPPPPPAIPYSEDEPGVDVTHLLGVLQLNDTTCRWPHGDPLKAGFGFCGQNTKAGSVYCTKHHRLAYTG